jgi:transcriptional regulator with XRE-family HTH domain
MLVTSAPELGSLIRDRRQEAGLTAMEAADLAGVSRRLLLEVERGKRPNVGFAAVMRILALLGLELDVRPRGLPGARSTRRPEHDV